MLENKPKKRQDTDASVQLVRHDGGPSMMLSKNSLDILENQRMASSLMQCSHQKPSKSGKKKASFLCRSTRL